MTGGDEGLSRSIEAKCAQYSVTPDQQICRPAFLTIPPSVHWWALRGSIIDEELFFGEKTNHCASKNQNITF